MDQATPCHWSTSGIPTMVSRENTIVNISWSCGMG